LPSLFIIKSSSDSGIIDSHHLLQAFQYCVCVPGHGFEPLLPLFLNGPHFLPFISLPHGCIELLVNLGHEVTRHAIHGFTFAGL
jgi:hypothetical protein